VSNLTKIIHNLTKSNSFKFVTNIPVHIIFIFYICFAVLNLF